MDQSSPGMSAKGPLEAGIAGLPKTNEFSRGWSVLVAATIGVGLGTTGLPFYSFGQFVRPLAQTFNWNRGEIAGGITCLMIGTVLTSPLVGRAVDRFGYRLVALLSQTGLALGFLAVSFVTQQLATYYIAWLALSFLGSGTSPIVWTRAVAGRFDRSRGLALGIMLCGTGAVAIIAPLIINQIIGNFGWRAAYRVLAATLIVIGMPITFAMLHGGEHEKGPARPVLQGLSLGEAIRGSAFWRLELAFFLISIVVGGLIVHLPALLVDRGSTTAEAAAIVGALGYAIIVGRLSLGLLVDRFSPAIAGSGLILLSGLASVLLALGITPLPAVLLLGLCAGAEVDLLAFLISRLFGLRHYAQIYGWGISAFTAGAGVGPYIAGHVHDTTGHYTAALYGFAIVIAIAAGLIFSLGANVNRPARAIDKAIDLQGV